METRRFDSRECKKHPEGCFDVEPFDIALLCLMCREVSQLAKCVQIRLLLVRQETTAGDVSTEVYELSGSNIEPVNPAGLSGQRFRYPTGLHNNMYRACPRLIRVEKRSNRARNRRRLRY